jgi:transglutaminase-like putative cysteine protease
MGSEARARLGLLALTFIVLLSFNQLFGQQEFAGPSLLGMLVATGVALGCRRLGLWPTTTLAVSVAALAWYLTLIFQAPHTFYGLPTIEALRRLGVAIGRSYEQSHIDYAPVPLRPGYAILTVAAIWMCLTLGEVATFRWRRPLLASLPPIALFAFLMIVGTQQAASISVVLFLAALFTYWALESAHRLRSWGRWVSVWKGQRGVEPPALTTGLARRMGVSCVAAALVLPVFMPALENGLLSWRSEQGQGAFGAGLDGGSGSGAGGSGAINPLVSLVPRLIQQSTTELFRVRAGEPEYWRLFTLGSFDGETWSDTSVRTTSFPSGGSVPLHSGPPTPGRTLAQDFTITGLAGGDLPSAGVPITVAAQRDGSFYVDPLTGDLSLGGESPEGFRYLVQATVPDATFKDLKKAEPGLVRPTSPYLQTGGISPAVAELAEQWTAGMKTDIQKLAAIQGRLRGFDYDLQIRQPVSADYLEEFLLTTRVGYCQQFATAFAVLARHLGYATRVVVGFLPGQTDIARPGNYVVTGEDTHAWPEVLFEGYGWIRFEPTPRGQASEPIYTVREIRAAPTTISGAEAPTSGTAPGQAGLGEVRGDPADALRNNKPNETGREPTGAIKSKWQETFARILVVLVVSIIAFLAFVPLLKGLRIRRRYARARTTRQRAAAAFAEFQDGAAELASPRGRSESAAAYARRVSREAGLPLETALRLAGIFEAAEFGPVDPAPPVAEEAKRLTRQLKGRMWAHAGWLNRARRLWSLRSLRPSGLPAVGRLALSKTLSLGRS